jgi:hypothetical protein
MSWTSRFESVFCFFEGPEFAVGFGMGSAGVSLEFIFKFWTLESFFGSQGFSFDELDAEVALAVNFGLFGGFGGSFVITAPDSVVM